MSYYGNDLGTQGTQIERGSVESVNARLAKPAEGDRRHRSAGWWPGAGTAVKVVLLALLVIVAIGWALTLLN